MTRHARFRALLGRFQHGRSGNISVEFAMIGGPFLILLCAIMAAAMQILAQQTLDDRVDDASRALFTGTFQKGANPAVDADTRLRDLICSGVRAFSCSTLQVEVTIGTSFSNPSANQVYNPKSGAMNPDFGKSFTCPTGDQIITVRAAVEIPGFFRMINVNGIRLADGSNLISSTAVFRTEPYTLKTC